MLSIALVTLPLAVHTATPPIFRRPDVPDARYLELGERFDATVVCPPGGSGTLIGDRWVVTAAHVCRGMSAFEPKVIVGGREYEVARRFPHPDSVSDGRRPPKLDLALVELKEPVKGVEPVPLYRESDEVGKPVFVVGFGDYGVAHERPKHTDGKRRAATNIVERIEFGHIAIDFDEPAEATELEGMGAAGDSGGSLFVEEGEGLALLGVSFASVGAPPGHYGALDLYVRVSRVAEWIDAVRAKPDEHDSIQVERHDVTHGFPDDATGALAASLMDALNGVDGAAESFCKSHRSKRARRRSGDAAVVRRIGEIRGRVGELKALELAIVGESSAAVLCDGKEGRHVVSIRLSREEGEPRVDDFAVR